LPPPSTAATAPSTTAWANQSLHTIAMDAGRSELQAEGEVLPLTPVCVPVQEKPFTSRLLSSMRPFALEPKSKPPCICAIWKPVGGRSFCVPK
jgi:hypothetical protein